MYTVISFPLLFPIKNGGGYLFIYYWICILPFSPKSTQGDERQQFEELRKRVKLSILAWHLKTFARCFW